MDDRDLLTTRFEAHRERLFAVATRMTGSRQDADDAVQEAWLRLERADKDAIDNLGGWLTTVVARVCLDTLRSRGTKREVPMEELSVATVAGSPEEEALANDSLGAALSILLDSLASAERLTFVLHDLFAVSYEEIAPIVGRSPLAARQLASRARRRLQSDSSLAGPSEVPPREVVAAFLAAAREGDFSALLRLLDPDVVLRADAIAIEMANQRASAGAPSLGREMRGVDAVSRVFASGARAARLAVVDGTAGAVVVVRGVPMAVFDFTIAHGLVIAIDIIADPETLQSLILETS